MSKTCEIFMGTPGVGTFERGYPGCPPGPSPWSPLVRPPGPRPPGPPWSPSRERKGAGFHCKQEAARSLKVAVRNWQHTNEFPGKEPLPNRDRERAGRHKPGSKAMQYPISNVRSQVWIRHPRSARWPTAGFGHRCAGDANLPDHVLRV